MGVINPIHAKDYNTIQEYLGTVGPSKEQASHQNSNIQAEQSVCTSLDVNAVTHSILIVSKNVRK
jgi:hypothetical protein